MPVKFLPFCIPVLILTVNEPDFMKNKVTTKTSLQEEGVWRVNFPGTGGAGTGMASTGCRNRRKRWLIKGKQSQGEWEANPRAFTQRYIWILSTQWCSYTHFFNWMCKNQIQYLDFWIPGGHPGFQLSSKGDTHRTVRRFRQGKSWLFNNEKV